MSSDLYRISYTHDDHIYEIYAKKIAESEIFGFLEVEDMVFGENTSLVVDPSEERLRNEFNGVKTTYIPTHSIIRIDRVAKQGVAKIIEKSNREQSPNVLSLPTIRPDKG